MKKKISPCSYNVRKIVRIRKIGGQNRQHYNKVLLS